MKYNIIYTYSWCISACFSCNSIKKALNNGSFILLSIPALTASTCLLISILLYLKIKFINYLV